MLPAVKLAPLCYYFFMENITKKLDFIDIKTSVAISSYYGLFIVLAYFLSQSYLPNIKNGSDIFKLYFYLDNSLGGYVISFFWAFLDALTLMSFIIILNKIIKITVK